jgi:soluble lytic murein transglycosylase-like protein
MLFIHRRVSNFLPPEWNVVHVLPLALSVVTDKRRRRQQTWGRSGEFRLICDCQRHSRRPHSILKRTLRIASQAAAVLLSIPLAFAALDIPTSAMNINLEALRGGTRAAKATAQPQRQLPIFTTASIRRQFLDTDPDQLTLDVFKEAYFRESVPYGAIIFREARRNHLPPELVAAMVHTESDFRPTLVSNRSAQGLMQIVPETARLLGIADPFDPEQNIAAGTKYYRYLLDRFDNETLALAAYNAGEGNVVRFGGIPPFQETRDYIARVSRRTHRYRERVHSRYLASIQLRLASVAVQ